MSRFYGTLNGSRGGVTRQGTMQSGMTAVAAGWGGAVTVWVYDEGGVDRFIVTLGPWQSSGGYSRELARGVLKAPQTPEESTLDASAESHVQTLARASECERMVSALRLVLDWAEENRGAQYDSEEGIDPYTLPHVRAARAILEPEGGAP